MTLPLGSGRCKTILEHRGTARKGITRTVVPAACGGASAPKAPGHGRPPVAQRATRHDRPRATPQVPDQDVPRALPARAPGSDRPCAAPSGPVADRSRPAQKVPGHGRPPVAQRAARHDRPRATPQAPGHDVPLVTVRRGRRVHGRPSAAQLVPDHHRSHPAPMAPPGHALARAGTYVPITTAPLPARVSRLLQAVLPRVPATPNTRTYSHSHCLTRHSHRLDRHSRESGNPRPPVTTGGAQGDYVPPTRAPSLRRKPQSSPQTRFRSPPGPLPWSLLRGRAGEGANTHPSSASCHPGSAPPAVLLHRVYGLFPSASLPRPAPARPPKPIPVSRRTPLLYMVERGPGGESRLPRPHHRTSPPVARIASSAEGFSSDETSPGSSAR